MSRHTVQMNVRISKNLKDFAVSDAKNQFHSLSKYVEKLISKEQERNKLLAKEKIKLI